MLTVTTAETYFLQALDLHDQFRAGLRDIKMKAFESGLLLISAKSSAAHGEWEKLLNTYGELGRIAPRTARSYMKFTADCIEWAKQQNPQVGNQRQLQSLARDMVLESALSFMELCREVGAIKARSAEGARDGKQQDRQLNFHFNFDAFDGLLLAVEQTGSNPFIAVNKDELKEARDRAARAVQLMDEALSATQAAENFLSDSSGLTPSEPSAEIGTRA